jgi:hypothetical protein
VACVAALVATQLAWGAKAIREFTDAEGSMRALSRALPSIAALDGYALVILPDTFGRVPFGRNSQAGLVLPPVQASELSRRLLVQTDTEIRVLDKQVDDGMVSALRDMSFYEFLASSPSRPKPARLAPSRYYCWRPAHREMRPLAIVDSGPGSLTAQATREYMAQCAVS